MSPGTAKSSKLKVGTIRGHHNTAPHATQYKWYADQYGKDIGDKSKFSENQSHRYTPYRDIPHRRTSYGRASLTGVHLTGAHLTGVHLTSVHLLQACISQACISYRRASRRRASLTGVCHSWACDFDAKLPVGAMCLWKLPRSIPSLYICNDAPHPKTSYSCRCNEVQILLSVLNLNQSPLSVLTIVLCQMFRRLGNRKPGLRLESGRIFEIDKLICCLPEKKWMSI